MLLSVVVPTCDRNDLLALCLQCLAPGVQTIPAEQYEVIVTDDGSRCTAETMMRERFPWARWTPGPRLGPAGNRNSGAAHARGEWLVFTDDDCLPSTGWLAAFAREIPHATEAGISVLEGRTTAGPHQLSALAVAPINESGDCLWSCNLALTRTLFSKLGGFDSGFPSPHLEDVDLRMRLADAGERWRFIREAEVIHPPRPLRAILRQVPGHESSFYFARKRGLSVPEVGLSTTRLARVRVKELAACRTAREFAVVAARSATEFLLLGCWWVPLWSWRYRRGGQLARAARSRMHSENLPVPKPISHLP
jgi:GT2 family glycosyltransferase